MAEPRVLMLFEPGLEYIIALFGIFLAKAVAVPSFPPIGSRGLTRLSTIIKDAEPNVILVSNRLNRYRDQVLTKLSINLADHPAGQSGTGPHWIVPAFETVGSGPKHAYTPIAPDQHALALLQYTSGSTSDPKGVMLTHANVLANCVSASQWMGSDPQRIGCSWLPPYHDMGLMGGIFQPIYDGFTTILMSPAHFIQRPRRWLQAITDYRATVSIAPDFAFELCVETVPDTEIATLDLSCLQALYCGAEPIRQLTLSRFSQHFAESGFSYSASAPCYGLAECTVFAAGKPLQAQPCVINFDKKALASNRLVAAINGESAQLVSSGQVAPGNRLIIVHPLKSVAVKDGTIGEIWVQGNNVGKGYWRKNNNEQNFRAQLPGIDGSYMRTGDLGAILAGELYVTGRLKDLIIIAGRNHYPQDIELSALLSDNRIENRAVVAFSIKDQNDKEQLIVVAEIKRSCRLTEQEAQDIRDAIQSAIIQTAGIQCADIYLVAKGSIPVTTSGKLQRRATQASYLDGTLRSISLVQAQSSEI